MAPAESFGSDDTADHAFGARRGSGALITGRASSGGSWGKAPTQFRSISSLGDQSTHSIPEAHGPIVASFNVVVVGSIARRASEAVCDDPVRLVFYPELDEGVAHVTISPISAFGEEIPNEAFHNQEGTAFILAFDLDSDDFDDALSDIARRLHEIRFHCNSSRQRAHPGSKQGAVPHMWCLFLTSAEGLHANQEALGRARAWAAEMGVEVLANGLPVSVRRASVTTLLEQAVVERLAHARQGRDSKASITAASARSRLWRIFAVCLCC